MSRLFSMLSFMSFSAISSLSAMEFGTMGNLSSSMGGAGVALKSPFGLYYNPALIASDGKVKFGYSASIGLRQSNLDKLSNINFNEILTSLSSLGSSLGGASGSSSSADSFRDALTSALQSTINSSGGSTTSNDLESLWQQYTSLQGNSTVYSNLVDNLTSSINSSSMSQGDKDLFNVLVGSIDWSNFDVANGGIKNLTIRSDTNATLDELMQNLQTLFNVLQSSGLDVVSQNGIVFQLSTKVMNEKFGSLAVGIFNTTQTGISIRADASRMRLIFSGDGTYYELEINDDGYTLKESDKTSYDNYSIVSSIESGNAHRIVSSVFNLTEIPIGYAYNFHIGDSHNLSLGATFKIMNTFSIYNETYIGSDLDISIDLDGFSPRFSTNVGIDLGAYYAYNTGKYGQIAIGVVAKNINYPTFKFDSNPTIVIKPQYRAGVAYDGRFFSLAFDADIWENELISYSVAKRTSQMIGGGAKFDLKYIDLRAGVAYDLRQDDGVILTGGINLLEFVDLAFEVGTKWVNYFGVNAPKYASVRLGGSFSF